MAVLVRRLAYISYSYVKSVLFRRIGSSVCLSKRGVAQHSEKWNKILFWEIIEVIIEGRDPLCWGEVENLQARRPVRRLV